MSIIGNELGENVLRLEPEAEKAARHKQALTEALEPVVAACEAARRDGFLVEYVINLNQFGVYALTVPPLLVKRY